MNRTLFLLNGLMLTFVLSACGDKSKGDSRRPLPPTPKADADPAPNSSPGALARAEGLIEDCGVDFQSDTRKEAIDEFLKEFSGQRFNYGCTSTELSPGVSYYDGIFFDTKPDAEGRPFLRLVRNPTLCKGSAASSVSPDPLPPDRWGNKVRMRLSVPVVHQGRSYRIMEWMSTDKGQCQVTAVAKDGTSVWWGMVQYGSPQRIDNPMRPRSSAKTFLEGIGGIQFVPADQKPPWI